MGLVVLLLMTGLILMARLVMRLIWMLVPLLIAAVPRALHVAQTAAQRFDFLFVRIFLTFGQFKGFQHAFHVIQRFAQAVDDAIDLFDRLLN